MAEFDQRIQQIQRSIEGLTSSLKDVESAVSQASKEFNDMARNAETINQVATSVNKLERLVSRLEKTPFAERLKSQISLMSAELQKLDTSRLQTVTSAIEAQAQAQKTLNTTQINLNANFRRTKEIVDQMIAGLGSLSQAAEAMGTRASTAVSAVGTALESVTKHEQQVQRVVDTLNRLEPGRYNETAQALREIANAAERVSKADLSGLSNISRPRRNAAQAGPTQAAIDYAARNNIDISGLTGRVTIKDVKALQPKPEVAKAIEQVSDSANATIQKKLSEYNRLAERAAQIDKALAQVASARERAFQAAVEQQGITDPKLQKEFYAAIMGTDPSKRYALKKEYRSQYLNVEQSYEYKLSKESIQTDIKKLEQIAANDNEALKELARLRKLASEYGAQIRSSLGQLGAPTNELPSFSRASAGSAQRAYQTAVGIERVTASTESVVRKALERVGIVSTPRSASGGNVVRVEVDEAKFKAAIDRARLSDLSESGERTVASMLLNRAAKREAGDESIPYAAFEAQKKIISQIQEPVDRILGHGFYSTAFKQGDQVLKVSVEAPGNVSFQPNAGFRQFDAPFTDLREYERGSSRVYTMKQQLADIAGVTEAEYDKFKKDIFEQGYFFSDPKKEQIGKIDGQIKLIDYGAVSSIQTLVNQYGPGKTIDLLNSYLTKTFKTLEGKEETRLPSGLSRPDIERRVYYESLRSNEGGALDSTRSTFASKINPIKESFRAGYYDLIAKELKSDLRQLPSQARKIYQSSIRPEDEALNARLEQEVETQIKAVRKLAELRERYVKEFLKSIQDSDQYKAAVAANPVFYGSKGFGAAVQSGDLSAVPDALKETVQDFANQFETFIRGMPSKTDISQTAVSAQKAQAGEAIENLYAFRTSTDAKVLSAIREANKDKIGSLESSSFIQKVTDAVKNILQKLRDGIVSAFSYIKDFSFGDIVDHIRGKNRSSYSAEVAIEAATPSFSRIATAKERSDSFSRNVYRPVSFGVSQFGAGLNAFREIFKGIQDGGPGGLLDIIGGAIKFMHTLSTVNRFFGLGIMPKGVGDLFTQRRSDTLLDLAEFGVGLKTGYRRGPINEKYRRMLAEAQPLEDRQEALKGKIASDAIPDSEKARLKVELNEVNEELRKLRRAISAYRFVMEDEAKGMKSTGASLDGPSFSRLAAPDTLSLVRQMMSSSETALSQQASQHFREFAESTGLQRGIGAGISVIDQAKILEVAKKIYGQSAIEGVKAEDTYGLSAPVYDESGKRVSSLIISAANSAAASQRASTLVHESIHELFEQEGRQGKGLYSLNQFKQFAFNDSDLELSRRARLGQLGDDRARQNLAQHDVGYGFASYASQNKENLKYYFDPREIYAYVGQALVTGNKQLEQELIGVYGEDLYRKVERSLKQAIPDTFGDEALEVLRRRFADFDAKIAGTYSRKASDPDKKISARDAVDELASLFNIPPELINKFWKSFSGVAAQVGDVEQVASVQDAMKVAMQAAPAIGVAADDINEFRELAKLGMTLYPTFKLLNNGFKEVTQAINAAADAIPVAGEIIQDRESRNRIASTAMTSFMRQGSFADMAIRAGLDSGIKDQFKAITDVLTNPNKANVQALKTSIEQNPDLLRNTITNYTDTVLGQNRIRIPISNAGIVRGLSEQLLPDTTSFRDQFNAEVQKLTGQNIARGTFQQQETVDPSTGMRRFALSAQTATGAMISLNGRIDEFGNKRIDKPVREMGKLGEFVKQIAIGVPRQLGEELAYGAIAQFQQMLRQLVSIQDELNEVANLLGVVGDAASEAKADFLFSSVSTAVNTGQNFESAIQANLKNFKVLGSVQDIPTRERFANEISEIQLGAQTAFGVPLEQSLEIIPSILSVIRNGMEDIQDPTEQTTAAIAELRNVMDQVVAVQRVSGAAGSDLILTYSRLAQSAEEYGLSSKQLLAVVAAATPAIGKGGDENTNAIRAFLEGTYSSQNASTFAKSGIATKTLNERTGFIENRSFEDVLRDLYNMSKDESRSVEYNQLIKEIAGPIRAVDIRKTIASFGNYDVARQTGENAPEGTFTGLVEQKSANLQGSLNKLEATGTQFLGSLLVGTGTFDRLAEFFDTLSHSALQLTKYLNENASSITRISNVIAPLIEFFTIGRLTKDVNIFSPLAKGIDAVELKFKRTFAMLTDFGKEGEFSGTRASRSLKFVGVALDEISKKLQKVSAETNVATASFSRLGAAATQDYSAMRRVGATSLKGYAGQAPILPGIGGKALPAIGTYPDAVAVPNGGMSQFMFTQRDNTQIANKLNSTANLLQEAAKPSRLTQFREMLGSPLGQRIGGSAGAMLAPVGFDLLAGGFNKDSIINTAGAGIAGAFAGALTGPQGAIIGYTVAKGFMEYIDLPGIIGTSEKEADQFARSIVNKGQTAEELKPEEQRIEEKRVLDEGIREFKKRINIEAITNAPGQLGGLASYGYRLSGASANDLAEYQRLVVKGEGSGIMDEANKLILQSRPAVGGLYDVLSQNEAALDAYIQSGVSSVEEFTQLLNDAEQGKGPLADKVKELGYAEVQKTRQLAENAELDKQKVLLEAANDIIKRINDDLTEFQTTTSRMRELPLGLTQYGELGSQTLALDEKFAPQLAAIRSGKITGQDAQRIMQQYDTSRAAYTAMPGTLQQLLPFAQDMGLNTRGLEQQLYDMGAEGQGMLQQRFGQAIEANQFVQDYESRQRALKQYESSDLYKAKDAAILKEHETLKKALATDQARYAINKQYLEVIKAQSGILLDQADSIEKQNQTRQLISAGTPAQFSPLSIFNTQGFDASQINEAIESALSKQAELEKLSPGYRKYFAEQQFLMQGQGGFRPVTGIDQGFLQEALSRQQSMLKPPSLEDLSQFSDTELQKILGRARNLQDQAVAMNPDLAGKYDDERIMIYRKNNQLLQETGLSQEYLKLAIQENTKSNNSLRGHYNLPSSYRAPTIWDYYNEGGKETGDVNFPNQMGKGSMVPLSFAQQLAQEILNAPKGGQEGADLSAITTLAGPGSSGRPQFYSGGSAAVWSDPIPQVLPDRVKLPPRLPENVDLEALRNMSTEAYQKQRKELEAAHARSYDLIESMRADRARRPVTQESVLNAVRESAGQAGSAAADILKPKDILKPTASFDEVINTNRSFGKTARDAKDGLDGMRQSTTGTNKSIASLATAASEASVGLRGAAALATSTQAFNGAVSALVTKVQQFDLAKALKSATVQINVVVNGQRAEVSSQSITNSAGGGSGALTGTSTSKSGQRIS